MKKLLSFGIEDFKAVKSNCNYVDKTMIINDLISRGESTTFLYTRPKGFGKSLTLSMLSYFFSDKYDTKDLFIDSEYIKRYPNNMELINSVNVVRLDFKLLYASSINDFYNIVKQKLASLFNEQLDGINVDDLYVSEKSFIERITSSSETIDDMENSLYMLTKIVFNAKRKKSLILIDEYDVPCLAGYENGYMDEIGRFLKIFLGNVLKGNEFLYRAVLAGVNQIETILSDVNQIIINSIIDNRKDEYFGFSKDETIDILNYFGFTGDVKLIDNWYGGYVFQNKQVFNPWSILSFIDNGYAFMSYLLKEERNNIVKNCFNVLFNNKTNYILEQLLSDSTIVDLYTRIDYDSLNSGGSILSLLVNNGYLSAERISNSTKYNVFIPNIELRAVFYNEILSNGIFKGKYGVLIELKEAVLNRKEFEIGDLVSKYICDTFPRFDLLSRERYKFITDTITSIFSNDFYVESEINVETKEIDIYMRSKGDQPYALVFELKFFRERKNDDKLLEISKKVLKQVMMNKCYADAVKDGYDLILLYGVAFSKGKYRISLKYVNKLK